MLSSPSPCSWGEQGAGGVTLAVTGWAPRCTSYHLAKPLTTLGEETDAEVKDLHTVTQLVGDKGLLYAHFQLTPGAVFCFVLFSATLRWLIL